MGKSHVTATTPRRPLLPILFSVYLALLVWAILWKFAAPWIGESAGLYHPIKLVPFVGSGDAGASAPLEVLANILLFLPFGIYLRLFAVRRWIAVAVMIAASVALETVQHLISTGTFDLADVIANAAGGVLGLLIPATARVMLVFTIAAVVGVAAFEASPWHYVPVPDVLVPGSGIGR